MTHRDDQIAAAAAALDEALASRDLWLDGLLPDAEAIVDAVLPQVTTVDEVTALPHRTVLVSAEGEIFHWSWRMPMNLRLVAEGMLESGPLTVVWQPS